MTCAKPMVYVVDDDTAVRRSLETLVESAGWQSATFGSAADFLAFPRVPSPGCLVLDVMLPDLNGLELQHRVASERSELPVVFISGYGDVPMTVRAMKAGAVDFFTKPFHGIALLAAIDQAIRRSAAALERAAELAVIRDSYLSLSCRERQVMSLVVTGMLNKQVADTLSISEITVKAHRGHAMRKMKARSLADMVKMSARLEEPRPMEA
jgi:FixJ family two-component response regulator